MDHRWWVRLVVQDETRPFCLQNYCQKWATGSTDKHDFLFKEELGLVKGLTVKFRVDSNVLKASYSAICSTRKGGRGAE